MGKFEKKKQKSENIQKKVHQYILKFPLLFYNMVKIIGKTDTKVMILLQITGKSAL
jgi:hypothetical protein